jgi:NADPH:quinone reductase-like Zn-dependent oxidoreductase
MTAVLLTGHGGYEKLELREDVPVPMPGDGEVLVRVTAAGINNTDINTRTGWYGRPVGSDFAEGGGVPDVQMGAWDGGLAFPRIQGADAVGLIVALGHGVEQDRIGQRVVCDPYVRALPGSEGFEGAGFLGLDRDGAFAQYICVPARNAVSVPHDLALTDEALATLPCSGGTAMNMLELAGAQAGDLALVTGASGGVGTFLVQILKALGAEVIAMAGSSKMAAVRALGADHVIDRDSPDLLDRIVALTGGRRPTLVADVVGGPRFPTLLDLLRRGGRYVVAGAIGGAMVELDLRILYLKNLSMFGSAVYLPGTFGRLMSLVLAGKLTPTCARSWRLDEICEAQEAFLAKHHVGSMVLIPPRS